MIGREVAEWIGKTERKPRGEPLTTQYFLDRSMPEPNSGCWIWMQADAANGYGAVRTNGKNTRAHRASYIAAFNVDIPSTVDVCHRCDTRLCVNPDHLFVGSRSDNMQDCSAKGRLKMPNAPGEKCPAAKLTADDVRAIRQDGRSHRAIGRAYGVDKSTIGQILRGITWGGV